MGNEENKRKMYTKWSVELVKETEQSSYEIKIVNKDVVWYEKKK